METIKINFGYFWPDFNPEDNYFTKALSPNYKVEISNDPDLFFFTHAYNGKRDYLNYKCHRVFLGWENERADWTCCDYVLDSDFVPGNPRHKRWPIWAAWDIKKLLQPKRAEDFLGKKKFACMVVSNANAKERIDFFQQLSKYKQADSGGKYLNNVGGPVTNKMDFIKDYKFVISFENSSHPGYTTEKLIEPMLVNSIPVYWGNTELGKDFNTKSFVQVNGFRNYKEAIDRIIELDKDEEKYRQMVAEPWFNNNKVPDEFSQESLQQFFDFVITDSKTKKPVATSFYKNKAHALKLIKKRVEGKVLHRLGVHKGFR
ncbi:MAG TPA: glycosyltransferase family 10 [Chitinophagaceae bacterium]|nr:glycosyltransferase family 10 [Chitinophagaceae bacterium]